MITINKDIQEFIENNDLDTDNVMGEISNGKYSHLENCFKRRNSELGIVAKRKLELVRPKEVYYYEYKTLWFRLWLSSKNCR